MVPNTFQTSDVGDADVHAPTITLAPARSGDGVISIEVVDPQVLGVGHIADIFEVDSCIAQSIQYFQSSTDVDEVFPTLIEDSACISTDFAPGHSPAEEVLVFKLLVVLWGIVQALESEFGHLNWNPSESGHVPGTIDQTKSPFLAHLDEGDEGGIPLGVDVVHVFVCSVLSFALEVTSRYVEVRVSGVCIHREWDNLQIGFGVDDRGGVHQSIVHRGVVRTP